MSISMNKRFLGHESREIRDTVNGAQPPGRKKKL